jgi:hypothetical protein
MNRDSQQQGTQQHVFRPQVVLERAKQLQVYNALFTADGVRCHQCSYRKLTDSAIVLSNSRTERCEFEGKRWVFAWQDTPELSSRAYMVSLFSEYASVGGAFHDALSEKYAQQQQDGQQQRLNNGDSTNIFQMLIQHPFITQPNDDIVAADNSKQRIAGLMQMAQGSHAMFSGLSPSISYNKLPDDTSAYFQFKWPQS